jgi:3-oxoacyl-[acyl-carrier-protein] synthase III
MPDTALRHAAVRSVASTLPKRVVPNAPIAERAGVTEDWIVARTGIRERRAVTPDERLTDLATAAGAAALERAGLAAERLDLVLVGTTSQDELTPNAAPIVAHELGAHNAGAMDVGAACTAFVSALATAAAQIEADRAEYVLVIGADVLTRHLDPTDKRTAALFGDGAGAAVLAAGEGPGGVGPVVQRCDGGGAEFIIAPREDERIRMRGQDTFKHAVARLTEVTRQACAAADVSIDDIDLFAYHQANARITRAVGERLQLDTDRVLDVIERTGNTSAASIPLALDVARREQRLRPGDRVLLAAFGAGLTWGGCVVEWSEEGVPAP